MLNKQALFCEDYQINSPSKSDNDRETKQRCFTSFNRSSFIWGRMRLWHITWGEKQKGRKKKTHVICTQYLNMFGGLVDPASGRTLGTPWQITATTRVEISRNMVTVFAGNIYIYIYSRPGECSNHVIFGCCFAKRSVGGYRKILKWDETTTNFRVFLQQPLGIYLGCQPS